MIGLITGIAAMLSLFDLFSNPGDRVLPWWGDAIVMGAAGVFYVVARRMGIEDDDD